MRHDAAADEALSFDSLVRDDVRASVARPMLMMIRTARQCCEKGEREKKLECAVAW